MLCIIDVGVYMEQVTGRGLMAISSPFADLLMHNTLTMANSK